MQNFVLFLLAVALTAVLACAGAPAASTLSGKPAADTFDRESPRDKTAGAAEETERNFKMTEAPAGVRPAMTADRPVGAPAPSRSGGTPAASNLKAGFSDDNKEFNYFLGFLEKYAAQVPHKALDISERIILKFTDAEGKAASAVRLTLTAKGFSESALTPADGQYSFYPSLTGSAEAAFALTAEFQGQTLKQTVSRNGRRELTLAFPKKRTIPSPAPVDIVFALDTTGSMGEEIARLKATIEIINLNLTNLPSKPRVRFGLVLYKDRGDEYVTKVVPLTDKLDQFQAELDTVEAGGGGDTPEDLVQAWSDSLNLDWDPRGVRQVYAITDAPPQFYPDAGKTYDQLARDFRSKGIKVYSVGTGGLPLEGEYILRQVSQFTGGKYIFLTYGEQGESDGGAPGSVSHHSGSNFQTDKLESIIIKFAKEDIQAFTGLKDPEQEDYFEAKKIASEDKEQTLQKLFTEGLTQLVSFSSLKLDAAAPVAVLNVLPGSATAKMDLVTLEYLTSQLLLTASRQTGVSLVDRKDLPKLLQEMEFGTSGVIDEATAAKVGSLLGAKVLLLGSAFEQKDRLDVFLKLVRVETGEILALTKLRLANDLLK